MPTTTFPNGFTITTYPPAPMDSDTFKAGQESESKYEYPGLPNKDPEILECLKQLTDKPLLYIEPEFEIIESNIEITDKQQYSQSLENRTEEWLDKSGTFKGLPRNVEWAGVDFGSESAHGKNIGAVMGIITVPVVKPQTSGQNFEKYYSTFSLGMYDLKTGSRLSIGVEVDPIASGIASIADSYVFFQWYPGPRMRIPNIRAYSGDSIAIFSNLNDSKCAYVHIFNKSSSQWTDFQVWEPDSYHPISEVRAFWGVNSEMYPGSLGSISKLANYGRANFSVAKIMTQIDQTQTPKSDTIDAMRGNTVNMMNQGKVISVSITFDDTVECIYTGRL